MLHNTPKSVLDAISKIVSESNSKFEQEYNAVEGKLQLEAMKKMKMEYVVPEGIEKEGVAHFMGAAAAAHKAGHKKFSFGGKVYPVQIKPHIAKKVNEEESVKEEVEELDEISKKTLGSYVNKASVDMANRTAEGERTRTLARADYAVNIRRGMSPKNAEADMKKDYAAAKPNVKKSVQRMRGIEKAVGRLTKEDAEVEEVSLSDEEIEKLNLISQSLDLDEGRGRPRKHPPKPMQKRDDDDEDDYGPDTGPEPDQNIVNHLKKAVDTQGQHDVKFGDGSSHKVPHHVAHTVLSAMGKLKPADRLEVQKHIHQSHKNLMDVHRMIK